MTKISEENKNKIKKQEEKKKILERMKAENRKD